MKKHKTSASSAFPEVVVSANFAKKPWLTRIRENRLLNLTGRLGLDITIVSVVAGLALFGAAYGLKSYFVTPKSNSSSADNQTNGGSAGNGIAGANGSGTSKSSSGSSGNTATHSPIAPGTSTSPGTTGPPGTNNPAQPAHPIGALPTVYFGAFDPEGESHFEGLANKRLSIYHNFYAWADNNATVPGRAFPTSFVDSVRNHGSIPMLTWNPYYKVNGNVKGFKLADISSGMYDSYITSWAQSAKSWGHPFFLRTMHEANGDWYPWSVQKNSYQSYIDAWRHIHDIFNRVGVTNATWVWCPNITNSANDHLADFYPGDSYVDWVAMDGYNRNQWRSFATLFGHTYTTLTTITNKPVMIAETASDAGTNGNSRNDWLTDALAVQIPQNFPRIKAFLYFNAGGSDDDATTVQGQTLSQTDGSAQAFANAIASPYYVSNVYKNTTGGPISAAR